jgi:hypothetical protein
VVGINSYDDKSGGIRVEIDSTYRMVWRFVSGGLLVFAIFKRLDGQT